MAMAMAKKIEHHAYARIGFLGNPSDGYYGNTIALAIANFKATVTLEPSDTLVIRPHPVHDPSRFDSLQQLVRESQSLEASQLTSALISSSV
jgi:glucuronokinase